MKLVIVEDQLILREALRRACAEKFGHEVVGEAGAGAEALEVIRARRPEAVILDLGLPDVSGLTVAERMREAGLTAHVLILSGRVDEFTVYRADRTRVQGFVDKNSSVIEAVRDALDALAAGKTWFSPSVQALRRSRQADPLSFAKVLSDGEQRVLALIARGLDDGEIGTELAISRATAQTHRSNILRKLEIDGTPKLVAFAIRHGFTGLEAKWS